MHHEAPDYSDLGNLAHKRLPRGIFAAANRGGEGEFALGANRDVEGDERVPSALRDVSTGGKIFGLRLSMHSLSIWAQSLRARL